MRMRRMLSKRGYTDKLYYYNFVAVHLIVSATIFITAIINLIVVISGYQGTVDLSAMANIPQWSYTELGLHTAYIVWKAKNENCRKYGAKTEDEE